MVVSPGRGAFTALPVLVTLLLAGCGGSVADADTGRAARTTRAPAPSAFCAAVAANSAAVRPLTGLTARGGLSAAVEAARISGNTLVDAAPPEVRADVQRTVDALNIELTALLAAGGDVAKAERDPKVLEQSASPDVVTAGQRVASYVNRNCQVSR